MVRTCTVCRHPERDAIDRALIAAEDPYRDIAARHGLTRSALLRHKADHITAAILAAWQRERADSGAELAERLEGWMGRVELLFDACHDFLADPDDPGRYTLAPHTWEVVIHTEDWPEGERRPTRRKLRLADALARVDGRPGVGDVTLVEAKVADPRKLIIDASKALEGHLRLLGELVSKLATAGTANFLVSPEWLALRGRMLAALAPYPDARRALAAAIEGEPADVEAEWKEVAD